MSSRTGICRRCGRELRGAIETSFMSLGRLVCITSIETPDCNWTRCRVCKGSVCKTCYLNLESMCAFCFVAKQIPHSSINPGPDGTRPDGPDEPVPQKRAA